MDHFLIFIFNGRGSRVKKRLYSSLDTYLPDAEKTYFTSVDNLVNHLRRTKRKVALIIFIPESADEIKKLQMNRYLIEDVKVICSLNNDDQQSKKIVHELAPRYISYSLNDFSDVSHVALNITTALQIQLAHLERTSGPI